MKTDSKTPTDKPRASKPFWANVDGFVSHVTGYECVPGGGMWWCPAVGYSLSEGHHLFKTEGEALTAAIAEVEKDIKELSSQHARLVKQKKGIAVNPRTEDAQ